MKYFGLSFTLVSGCWLFKAANLRRNTARISNYFCPTPPPPPPPTLKTLVILHDSYIWATSNNRTPTQNDRETHPTVTRRNTAKINVSKKNVHEDFEPPTPSPIITSACHQQAEIRSRWRGIVLQSKTHNASKSVQACTGTWKTRPVSNHIPSRRSERRLWNSEMSESMCLQ